MAERIFNRNPSNATIRLSFFSPKAQRTKYRVKSQNPLEFQRWSNTLTADSGVRLPYGIPIKNALIIMGAFLIAYFMPSGSRTEEFPPAKAGEFLYGTYPTFAGANVVRCATRKGTSVSESVRRTDEQRGRSPVEKGPAVRFYADLPADFLFQNCFKVCNCYNYVRFVQKESGGHYFLLPICLLSRCFYGQLKGRWKPFGYVAYVSSGHINNCFPGND